MTESLPLLDRPVGWDDAQRDREHGDTLESEELYKDMCRDLIQRWEESGLFSEESIISRLTEKATDGIWSHKDKLTETFNAFTTESPEKTIGRDAFGRMFDRAFPWANVPEAKSLFFGLLTSVSKVPLSHQAVPNSLDLGAFTRAMAILSLPSNGPMTSAAKFDSVISMRERSIKDQYRLLFQNLASGHPGFVTSDNQDNSLEPAVHPTAPWLPESEPQDVESPWYIDVSSENPYQTDLIDTLTSIQPRQRPFAAVARVFFKDVAARFPLPRTPLTRLSIVRSDVLHLTEFLVAFEEAKATQRGNSYVPSTQIKEKALGLVGKFVGPEQALLGWDEFGSIFAAEEGSLYEALSSSIKVLCVGWD